MTQISDPRKHIVPALYSWFCENFSVIHIHAVINHPKVTVPHGTAFRESTCAVKTRSEDAEDTMTMIKANVVTLNFGFEAINSFYQNSEGMGCKMRFNGIAHDVFLPYESIVAVSTPADQTVTTMFQLYYGQESLDVSKLKSSDQVHSGFVLKVSDVEESQQAEAIPERRSGLKLVVNNKNLH